MIERQKIREVEMCRISVMLHISLARVRIPQEVFFKDFSTMNFLGLNFFVCFIVVFVCYMFVCCCFSIFRLSFLVVFSCCCFFISIAINKLTIL